MRGAAAKRNFVPLTQSSGDHVYDPLQTESYKRKFGGLGVLR
jgi:hypothetical protein